MPRMTCAGAYLVRRLAPGRVATMPRTTASEKSDRYIAISAAPKCSEPIFTKTPEAAKRKPATSIHEEVMPNYGLMEGNESGEDSNMLQRLFAAVAALAAAFGVGAASAAQGHLVWHEGQQVTVVDQDGLA